MVLHFGKLWWGYLANTGKGDDLTFRHGETMVSLLSSASAYAR